MPQGAHLSENGVRYSFWAPNSHQVEVQILTDGGAVSRTVPLLPTKGGYFRGTDPLGREGDRYMVLLNGRDGFPGPASRSQPEGVHGPSVVVDPRRYRWRDEHWRRPAFRDLVIYELHVGAFSPEGTFQGAAAKLPYLRDLGVNAIELMPLADFPGERNWGYDGVQHYAPPRCYGSPDDLRALVDAAHAHGIAVILDVVYNHFGPDGNYLPAFSPYYFESEDNTPWGDAINFGRARSEAVRDFFKANTVYWMEEFHIDGFRLDATHAIIDPSPRHVLAEIAESVHARGGYVIAEDERNEARIIAPSKEGGYGFDGVWADDFHHTIEVALIDASRYRDRFHGDLAELVDGLQHGWIYRGQHLRKSGKPFGTPCDHLPLERFIFCISNHDQVGNRAFGERLNHLVEPATYRAASGLLLLVPYTPLLFMGQEWAASTPFLYFTDHNEELGRLVQEGRRKECRFDAFNKGVEPEAIPSPQAASTFEKSKLAWDELHRQPHRQTLALYRELLRLRREHQAFRPEGRDSIAFAALSWDVLAMRVRDAGEDWLLICDLRGDHRGRLEGEAICRLDGGRWEPVLSSNEARFGGNARPSFDSEAQAAAFTQPEALLLRAAR